MSGSRVSIVIPTRNRVEKLRRALASVDQQTFRDFEVWLVDDGSTDGTREFLNVDNLKRTYPNVKSFNILTNGQGGGAAVARNQALRRVSGEFVAFLDDDDVWLPDYLQWQIERLEKNPEATASCARYIEHGISGDFSIPDMVPLFEYGQALVYLLSESFIHTMSVFVCRSSAFRTHGLLQEQLSIVHDFEWYARLLIAGNKILTNDGPVLVRREVPGGLVTAYRKWYEEEQGVVNMVMEDNPDVCNKPRQIRAHRALMFARAGQFSKDYGFCVCRLMDAFLSAPVHSLNIIVRRVIRNRQLAHPMTIQKQG